MTEPEIDKEEEETSPVDEEEPENVAAEEAGDEEAEAANDEEAEAADDEDAEAAEEEPGEDGAPEEDAEAEEGGEDEDDDSLGATCEIEDAGPCKKLVKASVPADKVKEILDHNYAELATTVSLPGFRRGRVPRRLLEKRFGEDLEKDVKETLLAESFEELAREENFRILGEPGFDKVEFDSGSDFTYEADVTVYPDFDLPEYKGIEVEKAESAVEEGRLDEELEKLRKSRAEMVPVDAEKASADDQFIGSYELIKDDAALKTVDQAGFVPSSGNLEAFAIEDLEKLVEKWDRSGAGTSDGTPLEIEVTVPGHYPDEVLRGKEVLLRFQLEKALTADLPDLDEELAKALGAESIDSLKETIEQQLQKDVERQDQVELEKNIVNSIVEKLDFELPVDLIERQKTGAEERVAQEGVAAGKDEKEIDEDRKKAGEAAADDLIGELKEFFLLEKIGDKEKIFATEEEISQRIQMMSMVYGVPPATLVEQLQESGRIDEIRQTLRNEKVKSFLREKADIIGGESPQNDGETEGSKADETVEKDTESENPDE